MRVELIIAIFRSMFFFDNLFLLELLTVGGEACYGSNKNERGALSNE